MSIARHSKWEPYYNQVKQTQSLVTYSVITVTADINIWWTLGV